MAIYAADFSYHQGKIDASKFKNEILFGILRVQAGYTFEDPMHKNYEKQFIDNKIPFAEYAYGCYVSVSDAIAEAKSFLKRITNQVPKNKLRLAIDIEKNACKSKQELVSATQAFVNTVKNAGYDCGIYSGAYFFNSNNLKSIKCDFRWIASYALHDDGKPHFRPSISFDLWQFSSKGHLSGVTENTVDLNLPSGSNIVKYFTGETVVSKKSSTTVSQPKQVSRSWTSKYVSANELNVRSGRGANYGVVLVLPKNSKVSCLDGSEKNGWTYISYTNSKKKTFHGYVSSSYLSKSEISKSVKSSVKSQPQVKSVIKKEVKKTVSPAVWDDYVVVAGNLNVRAGRDTKYSSILVLPKGSKIRYETKSDKNGWGFISYTNSKNQRFRGYVMMKYIKKYSPSSSHSVKYHTVVSGDTLTKIAKENHMTLESLAKLNGFKNVNRVIYPGTKIKVV